MQNASSSETCKNSDSIDTFKRKDKSIQPDVVPVDFDFDNDVY
jgi:hypothetical protein